jgi:YggT family protein
MFVISNFITTAASIIDSLLWLYMLLVFGRIVISWVYADPYNPIVQFLYQVTEPVLRPIRRRVGIMGGIDFAPMILILGIIFLRGFLVATLHDLARRL